MTGKPREKQPVTARFAEAVVWLRPTCDNLVERIKDDSLPPFSTDEVFLELNLGCKKRPGGTETGYELSDEAGKALLVLAKLRPGAFDLAAKICGNHVFCGLPLPPSFRLLASEIITGNLVRPKGRKAEKTKMLNLYKLGMIGRVSKDFELARTRNDASEPNSACDAVSEAFRLSGYHVDYFSLKKICVEKRYDELRQVAKRLSQLIEEIGRDEIDERYSVPLHLRRVPDS